MPARALVIAGALTSGTGGLTFAGAGTLDLTPTVRVTPGRSPTPPADLEVNAYYGASTVDLSGGTLSGTGTVQSITATGGTINPAGGGSIGTLTTAVGAFVSTLNGSTLQVDLSTPAAADQLLIGSNATIDLTGAALNVNVLGSAAGNIYTILSSATGGISGTFTGLSNNTTFASGGRTFQIDYSPDAVTLTDIGAAAATEHWIGSAAANGKSWNVATNWLEDAVPVSGDTLVFDTTTAGFSATANGFAPNNNIAGLTNLTISINDASSARDFNLTGNAIGLSAAGITSLVSSGVNATVAMPLTLTATTTITVAAGVPLVVSGSLSGTAGLDIDGPGTLTLSGSSPSCTGATTVEAGTVNVNANYGSSPFSVAGGTLAGTGTVKSITATGGSISPAGNGTIGTLTTAAGAFASTLNGSTLQVDVNTPTASDELVIGNNATIDLTGGTLNVNVLGSAPGNVYTIVSSATGGISGTFFGLANNATFTVDGTTFQIAYSTSAVTLTDLGAGTTTLHWIGGSGANGNLWSVAANWLEDAAPASGDTLVFDTTTAGFVLANNGYDPVNDMAGLTNLSLILNDTSGTTNFNLTGNAIGLSATGITIDASSGNATVALPLTLPTTTTFTSTAGFLLLPGVLSGPGGINIDTSSTMILSGSNSFTGPVNVAAGILEVESNNALGSGVSTTAVATGATLELSNVSYTTFQPVTLAPGATFSAVNSGSGSCSFAGTITNQGTELTPGVIYADITALTLTGGIVNTAATAGLDLNAIAGGGALTLNAVGISDAAGTVAVTVGGGTVDLNAASNYTGPPRLTGWPPVSSRSARELTALWGLPVRAMTFSSRSRVCKRAWSSTPGSTTLHRKT